MPTAKRRKSFRNRTRKTRKTPVGRKYRKPQKTQQGSGIVNWLINHLPFEMHIPGMDFCGQVCVTLFARYQLLDHLNSNKQSNLQPRDPSEGAPCSGATWKESIGRIVHATRRSLREEF